MAQIKANEALVKALQTWNIDHLYGIPGDSVDAVVDSLRTVRDQFKFYHVRHEEVASLAAASYTKMTGKIGVALSIGGPGIVHLLNGICTMLKWIMYLNLLLLDKQIVHY